MGYNLYIGEFDYDVEKKERYVRATVRIEEPIGPLNSSDRRDNQCWPGYITWFDFCAKVGLLPAFYGGREADQRNARVPYFQTPQGELEGLLLAHPGCRVLTVAHYDSFCAAKLRYQERPPEEQDEYVNRRLAWLCWWTDWALNNCEYPSFANS